LLGVPCQWIRIENLTHRPSPVSRADDFPVALDIPIDLVVYVMPYINIIVPGGLQEAMVYHRA
jgi:hypothetical protein